MISADLLRHGHELAMASARLEAMVDLAEAWSPDVVVGGLSYIPGLLATRLKERPTTGARSRTSPLLGLASLKKKSQFRPSMSSRRASAILDTWVRGRLMKTPGG